jgi:NADPH:quinone reductase-like Zn-dependent oxidoreductase
MKAIIYTEYGSPDVLRYEEIEQPTPGDGEVLIRVRAASVNPLDCHLLKGLPYFGRTILRQPKVKRPGRDVAGQVEAVGRNVTLLKPGEEVFGTCAGSFAQYACAPENKLVRKPENVTFEQAASAPIAGLTALQALRDKGRVQSGQKVLINGGAGGVGTYAVQIAKSFGAEVTGVCSSGNVEMVRSIGADEVIDYTRQDFTTGRRNYQVILDSVSNHSLSACRRVLDPNGIYIMLGGPNEHRSFGGLVGRWAGALALSPFVRQKMVVFLAKADKGDLAIIGDLIASRKVKPVIDRCYKLSDVPEAMRYVGTGHARGKVVITDL